MKLVLATVAVGIALSGCATKSFIREEVAATAMQTQAMGAMGAPRTTREYAAPGDFLGPMPTAVVLLKKESAARNQQFCSGYTQLPTSAAASAADGYSRPLIPTRWPLKTDFFEQSSQATDCAYILGQYDFDRAKALGDALISAGLPKELLDGQGPIVAEILPAGGVLVANASSMSRSQLEGFATTWSVMAAQSVSPERDPKLPASCSAISTVDEKCSLEQVALSTATDYLAQRFPEIKIGVVIARRFGCALIPASHRVKWCGAGS